MTVLARAKGPMDEKLLEDVLLRKLKNPPAK